MLTVQSRRLIMVILAFVLVVPVYWGQPAVVAQAATLPVSQDLRVHGDYILVGNGVLTCNSASDTNCRDLLRGSTSNGNAVNDFITMTNNVLVTGLTNSSSATVTVPSGAKVVYAELIWSANAGTMQGTKGNYCSANGAATVPSGFPSTQSVTMIANGVTSQIAPASYTTDVGNAAITNRQPYYYSASADVSSLLASLPSGSAQTITVGNVWAPTGMGCYGGWALEMVYDYGTYVMGNSQSTLREVYTYDTYQRLQSTSAPVSITLNNLNVQGSGSRFGAVGWEGDMQITGDYVSYTTTSTPSTTNVPSPGNGATNNYFQSYADGSVPFAAYSASGGSKFYNASVSAASGTLTALNADDSTLNMNLGTNGDSYLLTNAMVSVPIADATIYKTAANGEADQAIAPGTAPTFRITVYNSGSVAVLGLAVSDPNAPDCSRTIAQLTALVQQTYPNGQLPAGGSVQYTCTGPATSTSLTNTASLTGQTPTGIPVSSTSSSKVLVATWNVAKTPSQPDVPVGGTATWTITVNNTGGAHIYNVNVADPSLPGCAKTVSLLQAGQTLTYTCTSTVTTTTTNTINVTGTAKASSTATITVPMTGTASGTVYADAVTLAKTVDKSVVPIGGSATFTFTVKNTGTSTLNTVALTDPEFPACNKANVGPLAPGATTSVTCTVTPFTAASATTLTNHATVTATPPSGTQITANSQVTVDNAALKLTKSASTSDTNGNGVLDAGDKVTYSFTVVNTGSVSLSGITVSDPKVTSVTCTPTTLAAGATATCTASGPYTVTQPDVDAGTLVNTATATGTAPDGTKATSTASVTLTPVQQPAITLKKVASPTTVSAVGQVVTYTLTATNSGNTTLTGVRPTDTLAGLSALSCTVAGTAVTLPATLAPQDVLVCTATRSTIQGDLDNGRITNSASVSGTSPKSTVVTDTASAPVTATQSPSIDVTKSGSSTTFGAAGQVVTYTYTLKNTGNVTLTGAQLNDPMSRLANKTCTPTQPATLLPGATLQCTATLTVTQADIDGGAILNTVTGSANPPSGAALTKQASWTLTPATAPKLDLTKSPSRTSITAAGQAITYTFTVTNSGNTTVNTVQVSDTLPGLTMGTCTPTAGSSLAPGAKMSCTASYTSTQGDVDAGKIVNNATATGTDSHGAALSATASTTVTATATPAITVAKSANPSVVNAVGQLVTYSFLVRNTGNVTLTSVAINDPLVGLSAVSCPATTLAPNATTTCTATRTTIQADLNAGAVNNTATASGTPPTGAAITSAGSTAKVTATQSPAFTIAKTPTPTTITAAGQSVSYSIVVTNTGNVGLTTLRVSDPRVPTLSCTPVAAGASLNPGQSTTCTGSYTATQADVNSGTINNTASATLTPPTGADITQTSSAVVTATRQPSISVAKTGSTSTVAKAGDVVTYTISAQNTGNVSLTSSQVTDPMFTAASPLTCTPSGAVTLAPGDVISCTGTHTVTQAEMDAGTLTNTATAKGTSPSGINVSSTSSFTVTATPNPAVALTKTANPTTISTAGRAISYTMVLTNAGNVSLSNAQISDPKFASFTSCSPALGSKLAPGATMTCTGSYTSTQADVDAGSILNTASAAGTPPTGPAVTTTAPAVVAVTRSPALTLAKSASPNRVNAVGQQITYSFLVTNTGNVTATSIAISDPLVGLSAVSCPVTTLAPAASTTCTATRTTTQADLDAASGTLTNTATVSAKQTGGAAFPTVTSSTTVTMTQTPRLSLSKTATPTTVAAVGDEVSYSMTLTNAGNVQVTNATITDTLVGALTCTPANGSTLAPGASITCTGTRPATQADLDNGTIRNTASGSATAPNGTAVPGATAAANVTATQSPQITLDKTADLTSVNAVGQVVNYSYLVKNTGNVTVGALSIADPHPGLTAITCPVTSLAPGASTTCFARYSVTQADLNAGSVLNSATASTEKPGGDPANPNDNVTASDSVVVPATQAPALSFSKSANVSSYSTTGRVITYSFAVSNTGNVDVKNVQVSDTLAGLSALSCTPALGSTLVPNGSISCTASYTTSQADIDAMTIVNNATATGIAPDGSTVTRTASRTLTATLAPNLSFSKSASPSTITAAGQSITYTFAVQNTGNATLHDVTIDEPMTGVSALDCSPATAPYTLTPGQELRCTATYSVTQADIDGADPDQNVGLSNSATVTGTANDNTTATAQGSAEVALTHEPAVSLTKTADPITYSKVGDVITYTFLITNSGNVSLHGFQLSDPVPGLSAFSCDADLATVVIEPKDSIQCTASRSIRQAGLDNGRVDNTAVVTALDPDNDQPVTGQGSATVTAVQKPRMSLAKSADRTIVSAVGDLVTYTVTMTNTGNVTLSNVFVADPLAGHSTFACTIIAVDGTTRAGTGPVTVYPGESKTCTTSRATTQADLDAGSILNTAHVDATTPSGTSIPTVNSNPVVVQALQEPAIQLVKTVSPRRPAAVGDTLTYSFTITNPGTVTVRNVSLSDPMPGLSGFTCDTPLGEALAPHDEIHCTATAQTTADQMNQPVIDNTATVTADAPTSPVTQVSSSSSAKAIPVHHPSLSLTKTHDIATVTAAGQKVVFTFTVTNTGNIAVDDIAVADDLSGVSTVSCELTSLPVGGSTTCSASYTATQADIDRGHIDNTARVTGVDTVGGDPVTPGEAQDQVSVTQNPHLSITKAPITSAPVNLGDDAQFRITVTNDGTTTLTNVQVDDPATNLTALTCVPSQGATLAPGDQMVCTAHLEVVQADIDAGTVSNTATVTGADPNGTTLPPVGDNAEIKTVVGTASATLTKKPAPATVGKAGDVVTYTFAVKNTGTVSLNDPLLTDDLPGLMNLTCDHDTATPLAPGVTMTCTATYTVLQADADLGHVDNTASFDAVVPPTMARFHLTAGARTQVTQSPSLSLSKNADRSQVQAVDDPIAYTFDVRNTGNVSVDFLRISDALPIGALSCVDAGGASVTLPTRLAPAAQLVCQATYRTTQTGLDAGSIVNSAKAAGVTDLGAPVASPLASTVVGVNQNPQVELSKVADTTLVQKVGDKVTYTIVAKNTGNVTVSGARVADPMAYDSFSCSPTQGSDLAPGATMTCTGVYSVVHTDLENGSISNVATFSGTDPNGVAVGQTAGTTVPALYNPKLSLQKTVSGPTNWVAGDTLTYRYTIENIGNMDAYYFVGNDTMVGLNFLGCWLNGQPSDPFTAVLHPGESSYCLATKDVTQADVDRGSLTNTVTSVALEATGQSFPPVTASTTTTTNLTGDFTITKTPNVATYNRVGQLITYTFIATNTGQLTLSSASFLESLAGISAPSCDRASVAPKASATCTATYSVTQADLDRGYIDNTVDLTARDSHGAVIGPRRGAAHVDAVQTAQLTLSKQALPSAVTHAGETVQFTLSSLNSGNVTLHGVTIADIPANATITGCDQTVPATLAPNSALNCTVDYVVSQDDINRGRVLNTATSDGLNPSGAAVKQATASATVPAQRTPGVKLAKTADVTSVDTRGQTVTYTLTATNTGNTTIFNTRVADPLPGVTIGSCTPAAGGALDPGQAMTCTATYRVTQPDLNAGHIDNTATVTGNNLGGDPATPDLSDSASRTVGVTMKPALALTKSANTTTVSSLTDPIAYTFVVTNTGNVSLHDVTVTDPLTARGMGPITCPRTTLDPTDSMTCSATFYPAQQDLDRGYIPNTATAKGLSPTGAPASEGVGSTRVEVTQKPAYGLTKTADHTDVTKAGEQVLYTFVGTNTGNVTLSNVTVSDPLPGLQPMDCYPRQPADLPPGATIICRAFYTVTQDDLDTGTLVNTATINGTDPQGAALDPVEAHETIRTVVHSELEVVKTTDATGFDRAGDVITYTLTAKNLGNQTIHDVLVTDLAGGASDITCTSNDGSTFPMPDPANPLELDPQTAVQCTVSYAITQADMDAGKFTNTARMTALDPTGTAITPATGSASVVGTQKPAIGVTKTASPATVAAVGEQVTYTIVTTNTGNVSLHGLTVSDPMTGLSTITCPSDPAETTLAPSESLTCTATYTITQADLDAGTLRNPVSVSGVPPSGASVSASGEATVSVDAKPSLTLVKTADSTTPVSQGQTVNYTMTLTNDGNQTAFVRSIADAMAGPAGAPDALTCDVTPPVSLAPNSVVTCHLAHVVTTDEALSGALSNTATAVADGPSGTPISIAPAVVTQTTVGTPSAEVVKEAVLHDTNGNGTGQPGEVVTYTITGSNTGDVTLRGVRVSDAMLPAMTCSPSAPAALAPGEKVVCSGSHTITSADVRTGELTNTASLASSDLANAAVVSVSVAVSPATQVKPPVKPPIADTGSPVSPWLLGLGIACTLGGALLLTRRRRRS